MAIKLEVRSKSENGFRRGGRHWGPEPVEVELEDEQANQVMRETNLFVRRLDGGPMPEREVRASAPFASGLSEGSKPVPSDKTGGRPEGSDAEVKASAPKRTGAGDLTPEQKAELEQQQQKNRR